VKKFINFAVLTLPCQNDAVLGECVSGIYSWSLAIVGIIAFVQIVYAGWIYLTAAGNTSKTGEAMSKISNAVLGIVLLFSSYLILNTINPDLVGGSFSLPNLKGDKVENIDYRDNDNSSTTFFNGFNTTTLQTGSGTTTTTTTTLGDPLQFGGITPNVLYANGHDQTYFVEGTGFGPNMEMMIYRETERGVVGLYANVTGINAGSAYMVLSAEQIAKLSDAPEPSNNKVVFYLINGAALSDFASMEIVAKDEIHR